MYTHIIVHVDPIVINYGCLSKNMFDHSQIEGPTAFSDVMQTI